MINNVNKKGASVQHHRKSSKYILAAILTAIFILIVWGICIIFNSFITVKEILVNGESIYTSEQIIATSEIETGDKKNKINVDAVENNILDSMSFISHVEVKIKANGIAHINITSEEIAYCSNIAGCFYVMSDEFKMLGMASEVKDRTEAIIIELPRVKKALVGNVVEFYEDIEYVNSFLDDIEQSFISSGISSIDVSDRYDLSVVYNDNYFIDFGDSKNIAKKIDKVQMLINSGAMGNMSKARIDVSDISNPTIKPIN